MAAATSELLRQMYSFEREARERLLASSRQSRAETFEAVYGEFYARFGAALAEADSPEASARKIAWQSRLFTPLVGAGDEILELGCGSAAYLKTLADRGLRCVGLDAHAPDAAAGRGKPRLVQGDAVEPRVDGRFDLVISNQLLEHLHPEDVPRHFAAVRALLKPEGRYAFCSPSAIIGPADVSAHFGCATAQGLHLKEWLYGELQPLLARAGYRDARGLLLHPRLTGGRHVCASLRVKIAVEALLKPLPAKLRRSLGRVFVSSIFVVARR